VRAGQRRVCSAAADNRPLPRGFDKATASADIGVRETARDNDFIGSGDRTRYVVDAAGNGSSIEVELRYQPIAPGGAQSDAYDAGAEAVRVAQRTVVARRSLLSICERQPIKPTQLHFRVAAFPGRLSRRTALTRSG
jgi:hypothetical protein